MKQFCKYASATTDMDATIEKPLEAMFSMHSMLRLYSKDKREKLIRSRWLQI
jgi:hypothetical protein